MAVARHRWLMIMAAFVVALGLIGCTSANEGQTEERAPEAETVAAPSGPITIAVPVEDDGQGRALLLLQDQGLIRLNDGADLTATTEAIVDNPNAIEIVPTKADAMAAAMREADFVLCNGVSTDDVALDPATVLMAETTASEAAKPYATVVAVNEAKSHTPKIDALLAALESQTVQDSIDRVYSGSVIPIFEIDDAAEIPEAGDDHVIKVGAMPVPYAAILAEIQPMLAERGWELQIIEFADPLLLNDALARGELDANYFQTVTALNDYNVNHGTALRNAAVISFEPLGLYGAQSSTLDGLAVIN